MNMGVIPLKEVWKTITDFDNYQVSNLGRIYSIKTGKMLKAAVNHKGYLTVCLYKDKKAVSRRVHRLVAEAFIPNPTNLPEVDHVYGDKQDNKAHHLKWASGSENTRNRDYSRDATSKYNGVMKKKNGKWQTNIYLEGKTKHIGIFLCEHKAARAFNQFCIENGLNRELNIITEV